MYDILPAALVYLEIIVADPRSDLRKRIKQQSAPMLEGKYINTTYELDDGAVIVHSELDFELAQQENCKYYIGHSYSLISLPRPNLHNLIRGILYQDKFPYLPWELRKYDDP